MDDVRGYSPEAVVGPYCDQVQEQQFNVHRRRMWYVTRLILSDHDVIQAAACVVVVVELATLRFRLSHCCFLLPPSVLGVFPHLPRFPAGKSVRRRLLLLCDVVEFVIRFRPFNIYR
jgi:hypothetical protein